LLGHEVRSDILKKPTQQLGLVLRKLGLQLAKAGTQKVSGRKFHRYRLDPVALAAAEEIVAQRERKGGWAFLVDRYGPHMDPSDGDDWAETEAEIERVADLLRGTTWDIPEEDEEE